MTQPENIAPQPDPQFIIAALQEELTAANANRLYLLAHLKQMQAAMKEAQAVWALERESLLKSVQD